MTENWHYFWPPWPSRDVFRPPLSSPNSDRSTQPQYSTKRPHFSTIFQFFRHFRTPSTLFLPLISLKSDPGTHLKRTGTKFSISWYQYDLWKRPRSNFMTKSLIFCGPIFGHFWPHHPGYPDHSAYVVMYGHTDGHVYIAQT